MKRLLLLAALLPCMVHAQYAGDYGTADSTLFQIAQGTDGLFFVTAHYGNIRMLPRGNTHFVLENVKPEIAIDFELDSLGKVARLLLRQAGKFTWIKDTPSAAPVGVYHQDIDRYAHIVLRREGDHLLADTSVLEPKTRDTYKNMNDVYVLQRDKKGTVRQLVIHRDGIQTFVLRRSSAAVIRTHAPDRHLGFTRADTLEGMPSPPRTCYDVLFYDLDLKIDPENKSLQGRNRIRFRATRTFDSLQIDLYANMRIDRILYRGQALRYNREYNAVYVHFPAPVPFDSTGELDITYRGVPSLPNPSALAGGIIWFQDKHGKPWVESVVQGSGGSIFWPGKDLLSDKPDSMHISVTVPKGLMGIANGRLQGKTDLADGQTRFDWYVSYPILNYDVAFYVGDYVHYADTTGSVAIDYYCLPYSLDKARVIFGGAPRMLALYERDFGPYPFARDGFKLVEGPYPMEHQGAVCPGLLTPVSGDYDQAEVTRTMWHESAHEWWGNSVSCTDFADLWIHEAFATYAEVLAYDALSGHKAAQTYLKAQIPGNKEPIIGVYNVNYFYLGDMYSKGCLLLHTLRNVMDNDSLWFSVLRGIQERLRYRSVTTEELVRCFNRLSGEDYTSVFDQYLRYTSIPVLQWSVSEHTLRYRWQADVPGFHMKIKINPGAIPLPATSVWQEVNLPGSFRAGDLRPDTDAYYVRAERVRPAAVNAASAPSAGSAPVAPKVAPAAPELP
jgi:hypothetical protein